MNPSPGLSLCTPSAQPDHSHYLNYHLSGLPSSELWAVRLIAYQISPAYTDLYLLLCLHLHPTPKYFPPCLSSATISLVNWANIPYWTTKESPKVSWSTQPTRQSVFKQIYSSPKKGKYISPQRLKSPVCAGSRSVSHAGYTPPWEQWKIKEFFL